MDAAGPTPPAGKVVRRDPAPGTMRTAALLVGLAVLLAFSGVLLNDFVNLDDPAYVTENPRVLTGLTGEGVLWAAGSFRSGNWHPLTWLSHMADVSLFGTNPAGHHATSLLLHAANALLCFLVLAGATGAPRRSAAAALLFALHPLRVESVAWVAERKDVLSGLFFFLVLGAHLRHARRPSAGRYAVVVLLFALGLATKPMLVTLPLVLLLLDWWPLGRIAAPGSPPPAAGIAPIPLTRAVLETIPLLGLSAVSSAVTLVAQSKAGAVVAVADLPLGVRVANAFVSVVRYLGKELWPARLSVLYRYPDPPPGLVQGIIAAAALALVTGAILRVRRRAPAVAVGWLWFLIMLVPVIGVVQVGVQAMADRYTYLPSVGLSLAAVWGIASLAPRAPRRSPARAAVVALLAALAVATVAQVRIWRDSASLFAHAVRLDPGNGIAHGLLGLALDRQPGRRPEALLHLREAARLRPRDTLAAVNLGMVAARAGEEREAIGQFLRALSLSPEHPLALYNLGVSLRNLGLFREAEEAFRRSLRSDPAQADAAYQLGNLLAGEGRFAEAEEAFRRALSARPGFVMAENNLGKTLSSLGRSDEALAVFDSLVRKDPGNPVALFNRGAERHRRGELAAAREDLASLRRIDPGLAAQLQLLMEEGG